MKEDVAAGSVYMDNDLMRGLDIYTVGLICSVLKLITRSGSSVPAGLRFLVRSARHFSYCGFREDSIGGSSLDTRMSRSLGPREMALPCLREKIGLSCPLPAKSGGIT